MVKHKKRCMSIVAGLLTIVLIGCQSEVETINPVAVGETISADYQWINSDIEGAIDENTKTDPKRDFHTYVNKDWIVNAEITEDKPNITPFSSNSDLLTERKLDIIRNGADTSNLNSSVIDISKEDLEHNQKIVSDFANLAEDWETREQLGIEPIRPYIEAISSVKTLDEMNNYILNKNGMNFTLNSIVEFGVRAPVDDGDINEVVITAGAALTLQSMSEYKKLSAQGLGLKHATDRNTAYLLGRLGYDNGEIKKVLKNCYEYEAKLTDHMMTMQVQVSDEYEEKINNTYTLEQIKAIEGNYPLVELLDSFKMMDSKVYTVYEPKYVKAVGTTLYTEKNLEQIKDYYIVHTINEMLPLLDRESFDLYRGIASSEDLDNKTSETEDKGNTTGDTMLESTNDEEEENQILLDEFISKYLAEPLDQIYIAEYCTSQQKENITTLIEDIISYYNTMLMEEDWLSEEARKNAVDKLDNICIRAVFPDSFTDYSSLEFDEDSNLVDAVATINYYNVNKIVSKINTKVNRNEWDLASFPTTQANAYYNITDNSINILAGMLADGFFYDDQYSYEEKLGKLGMVIGHEITHAFDDTGFNYDKDGKENSWVSPTDEAHFQEKTRKLSNFYNSIPPYPGTETYDAKVEGEAIADMGGVKCMLALAKKKDDFDYEVFFTSFSQMWRSKRTYEMEQAYAEDVHPLDFLRTNVTLQQFDEFYDTYDIKPGDGMYIEPEKRVIVW